MNDPDRLKANLASVEHDLSANWRHYRREVTGNMGTADPDDLSAETVALIDQRLGQAHDFMRDVIDDPRLLTVIPDGSTLFIRNVEIPGRQIRLVAYKVPGSGHKWAARLTGSTKTDTGESGHAIMIPASIESDESAEAALDAFEELIHTIVELAQEPAHRTA